MDELAGRKTATGSHFTGIYHVIPIIYIFYMAILGGHVKNVNNM